jgi:hypothetical protein
MRNSKERYVISTGFDCIRKNTIVQVRKYLRANKAKVTHVRRLRNFKIMFDAASSSGEVFYIYTNSKTLKHSPLKK